MPSLWTISGSAVIVIAIVGYLTFPKTLKMGLKSNTNLAKNGMFFPKWSRPPFLTNSSMFLFEVENPKQALNGEKIRVRRKGPYEFKVANNKENATFSVDEEQVSLYSTRKFFFSPEGSANIDERFYMLNPIVPGTHLMVKQLVMDKLPFKQLATPLVYQSVNVILDSHNERLFHKRSPRQILYGYKVELLENVLELANRFGLGSLVPEGPPENTFGVAFFQNVTEDLFTLYTGVGGSVEKFGEVIKWRGQDKMTVWKSKRCNKIEGTNGEIHKPFPEPDKPIKIFLAQTCRSLTLDPIGKTVLDSGLEAIEFELSKKLFQGVRSNPENICYCTERASPDCQLDGFASLGPCLFNSPIYLSKTNFLGADPKLKRLVEMNETDTTEGFDKVSFFLEPLTGAIVKADVSLMASVKVQRQQFMRDMGNIRNTSYVPFFLTHENIELPSSISWQLRYLEILNNNYGLMFLSYGLTGGALATYGVTKSTKKKDEKTPGQDNLKEGGDDATIEDSPRKVEDKLTTKANQEIDNFKSVSSDINKSPEVIFTNSDKDDGVVTTTDPTKRSPTDSAIDLAASSNESVSIDMTRTINNVDDNNIINTKDYNSNNNNNNNSNMINKDVETLEDIERMASILEPLVSYKSSADYLLDTLRQNTILIGVILATSISIHYYTKYSYWSKRGIKGPVPWPLFGTVIYELFHSKNNALMNWSKQYGRVYGVYQGKEPVLVVSDAQIIKDVLVKDAHIFPNHKEIKFSSKYASNMLFFKRDEGWKQLRSLMAFSLTSGKIKKMYNLMKGSSDDLIENISKKVAKKESIDLRVTYGCYTLDVIAKCAFAMRFDTPESEQKYRKELIQLIMKDMGETPYIRLLMYIFLPNFLLKAMNFQIQSLELQNHLAAISRKIIQSRGNDNAHKRQDLIQLLIDLDMTNPSNIVNDDVDGDIKESHHVENYDKQEIHEAMNEARNLIENDHLSSSTANNLQQQMKEKSKLRLSEDEIIGNCILFFIAGSETSSSLLSFASYALACYPSIQEQLYQEIKTHIEQEAQQKDKFFEYETVLSMEFLDAVISETLRMFPPAPVMDRQSNKDYEIPSLDITIPAGGTVQVPFMSVHYDPEYYPEPERFNPDRFLPENRHKLTPYTYLPFGAGIRHCLGMRFALAEAKLALARLVYKFKFTPTLGDKAKFPPTLCKSFNLLRCDQLEVTLSQR